VTSNFGVIEQDKKVLSKANLQKAMGKLEPAIKFRQADKTEVLIHNIIESTRTRDDALGQVMKVSRVSEGSQKDNAPDKWAHKETKIEPKEVATEAALDTPVEDVSEDLSIDSIITDPSLLAHVHAEQPEIAKETGAFESHHLACVLSAAFGTLKNITELLKYIKTKSDVFKKGVPLRAKSGGGTYNKAPQIAESIAKCRPDGVTTAHELLSWLTVSAAK